MPSSSAERPAARERCGKITDPGSSYPHPCVKPKGHDGECDPVPSRERPAANRRVNQFGRANSSPPLASYREPAQIRHRLTVLYDKSWRIREYNRTLDPQTLDGKQHGIMADFGCKVGRDRMPQEVKRTLNSTIAFLENKLLQLEDKAAA